MIALINVFQLEYTFRLTSYCFHSFTQNGYQGQKRNIVDDAKFETKVNEEEKRNWINIVRRKSQGM